MSSDRYRGQPTEERESRGRHDDRHPGDSGRERGYEPDAWDMAPQGEFRSQDRAAPGSGQWQGQQQRGGPRQGPGGMRGGSVSRGGSFDGYDREEPARQRATGGGYGEYNFRDEYSPVGGSIAPGNYGQGGQSIYGQRGSDQGGFDQGGYGQSGSGQGRTGHPSEPARRPGESPRGRFSGKGPKGYQRSDERVREDVSDTLERNGELDASEIEVVVVSGEVTLQGEVMQRRDKRLAEDLIEDLPGVKQVHNRLRVSDGSQRKENEANRSRQSSQASQSNQSSGESSNRSDRSPSGSERSSS